jgi:hypothetical protein
MKMRCAAALGCLLAGLLVAEGRAQTAPPQKAEERVNPDALIQKEFLDRVSKYVELRNAVEGKLPKLSDEATPDQITAHQKGLLRALQNARRGAERGDIFTPRTRALFRRLLARAAPSPSSAPRRAIQEENPGKLNISVNGPYPTTVPLVTVPPQLLAALPRLPDEQLEYRFLGTRLILLDSAASMVIDYMERAIQ